MTKLYFFNFLISRGQISLAVAKATYLGKDTETNQGRNTPDPVGVLVMRVGPVLRQLSTSGLNPSQNAENWNSNDRRKQETDCKQDDVYRLG